jgi:hypothetical protein
MHDCQKTATKLAPFVVRANRVAHSTEESVCSHHDRSVMSDVPIHYD